MKLVKTIANLGYGSRKTVQGMFREGRITDAAGEVLYADDDVAHADVRVDGEPLDPPHGLLLMLHKPVGITCSTKDRGRVVYGQLLHRITSPKSALDKAYVATLASDLRGDEAATFASGTLLLESEKTPLLPAVMQVLGPREARLVLHEGRYHQARRMFAAVGNHVVALHRERIGGLSLGSLEPGAWQPLDDTARTVLFSGHADA